MALSRLQTALASVTNEVTFAAANINFDFTLVKCEAPKEYQKLGNALSQKRKEQAEVGSTHITARRLGALFEDLCPPTPNLIRAYGTRVSEIAETVHAAAQPTPSIFAAHVGVDGTSIWAAATSSSTALQVQLLACMLARAWNAQEATSIWFELVNERRRQIASAYESGDAIHFATLAAAAKSEISRQSLAEWDASARSWLRTADQIKGKDQTQLMLIIANVNVAVNENLAVLTSVLAAWKSALTSMEKLISGMPQAVNCGPTLLALSSWHIYPDLLVMGNETADVRFNDPLVPAGGVFTVGLERAGVENGHGVYWSLSLKHLRFYGHSVEKEARLNQEFSRVSFSEFTQAVYGCVLGNWLLYGITIIESARFFISFHAAIERIAHDPNVPENARSHAFAFIRDNSHWFNIMHNAALAFVDKRSEQSNTVEKLIKLGLRRSLQFIPDKRKSSPFFGFLKPDILLLCLKGSEERVSLLRRVASEADNPSEGEMLIQYFDKNRLSDYQVSGMLHHPNSNQFSTLDAHYATARPPLRPSEKGTKRPDRRHQRWLPTPSQYGCLKEEVFYLKGNKRFEPSGTTNFGFRDRINNLTYECVFGRPDVAAIYMPKDSIKSMIRYPNSTDIIWCLDQDMFDVKILLRYIDKEIDPTRPLYQTMKAVSVAARIYKVLPSASVSIRVLEKRFDNAKWAKPFTQAKKPRKRYGFLQVPAINRATALACVAYLECGVDIDPSLLTTSFALAYENSLYIAMQLTCDPWEQAEPYELRRVLGNVGKPGVTLLVPPQNPVKRDLKPDSWRLISTNQFNGNPEDHFHNTSMHLSFTEYYVPAARSTDHRQDHEAFFWESVVSVHDSGHWVGDIDILKALDSKRVSRLLINPCRHDHKTSCSSTMLSVENWTDILDPPPESIVIRAHGNWIARLAVTAVLSQIQSEPWRCYIVICPDKVCWKCVNPNREKQQVKKIHREHVSATLGQTFAFVF